MPRPRNNRSPRARRFSRRAHRQDKRAWRQLSLFRLISLALLTLVVGVPLCFVAIHNATTASLDVAEPTATVLNGQYKLTNNNGCDANNDDEDYVPDHGDISSEAGSDEDVEADEDDEADEEEDTAKDGTNHYLNVEEGLEDKLLSKFKGIKVEKRKTCSVPPLLDSILRGDGVVLTDALVSECIDLMMEANDILNPGGVNCDPAHPNYFCMVKVDCVPGPAVYGVVLVGANRYSGALATVGTHDVLVEQDTDTTKRDQFYLEEAKVKPPDAGLYFIQRKAEYDIALLSNLLCIPTTALKLRSSSKSFFLTPEGVTVTRPELTNRYRVAHTSEKPYGHSKGWEINSEWIDEPHGRVPQRTISGLENVECIMLIEKEGKRDIITCLMHISFIKSSPDLGLLHNSNRSISQGRQIHHREEEVHCSPNRRIHEQSYRVVRSRDQGSRP